MGRLLAKGILFAVSLAALMLAPEALITSLTPWRRYEDPRTRILWDGGFDGSHIVLLGGSEFTSVYVDATSNALWARIEKHTGGRRVFPGALNGARPADILAGALHVSHEWTQGTTVLISLAPTRFLGSSLEERAPGNFAEVYFRRYGIDAMNGSRIRRVQGQLYARLLKPFFAARLRSAIQNLVDRPRQPGWMRQRVWYQEHEARGRFELLERTMIIGAWPRTFQWLDETKTVLEAANMRPVFVLTPLNEALVRSYAQVHSPDEILGDIRGTIDTVKTHLEGTRASIVDLTDGFPSQCFFDLVHLNTCGDELMAVRLAEWLAEHPDQQP